MNVFRSALDWLGWERLSETRQRHQQLIMKLSELAAALGGIDNRLTKAQTEITTEIQNLRDALSNVELPAEAAAALTALEAKAQALDDVVPDAPAPEPEAQA